MTISEWGMPMVITLLAMGVRCAIDIEHASLKGILRAVIIGIFVGGITNLYLLDYTTGNGAVLSPNMRAAIVGIASAFSQEIFYSVIKLGADPVGLIRSIFNK